MAAPRFSGRCAALPNHNRVLAAVVFCSTAEAAPRFSGRYAARARCNCPQASSSPRGTAVAAPRLQRKKLRFPSASFLSFSQAFPIKRSPSFFTPFSQAFPSKRSPSFFTPFFELLQFFVGHLFSSLSLFKGPTVAGPFLFILVSLEVLLFFLDLVFLNFLMCLLLFELLFFLHTHCLLV